MALNRGQFVVLVVSTIAYAAALLFLPFKVVDVEGQVVGTRYSWFGDATGAASSSLPGANPLLSFVHRLDLGLLLYELWVILAVAIPAFLVAGLAASSNTKRNMRGGSDGNTNAQSEVRIPSSDGGPP